MSTHTLSHHPTSGVVVPEKTGAELAAAVAKAKLLPTGVIVDADFTADYGCANGVYLMSIDLEAVVDPQEANQGVASAVFHFGDGVTELWHSLYSAYVPGLYATRQTQVPANEVEFTGLSGGTLRREPGWGRYTGSSTSFYGGAYVGLRGTALVCVPELYAYLRDMAAAGLSHVEFDSPLRLSARAAHPGYKCLATLNTSQGDVTIAAGNNVALTAEQVDDEITITINARPGAGDGAICDCDTPVITTRDIKIAGDDCYELVPNPTTGKFFITGKCQACCACEDFVDMLDLIKAEAAKVNALKLQLDATKTTYTENVTVFENVIRPAYADITLTGSITLAEGNKYTASSAADEFGPAYRKPAYTKAYITYKVNNMTDCTYAIAAWGMGVASPLQPLSAVGADAASAPSYPDTAGVAPYWPDNPALPADLVDLVPGYRPAQAATSAVTPTVANRVFVNKAMWHYGTETGMLRLGNTTGLVTLAPGGQMDIGVDLTSDIAIFTNEWDITLYVVAWQVDGWSGDVVPENEDRIKRLTFTVTAEGEV